MPFPIRSLVYRALKGISNLASMHDPNLLDAHHLLDSAKVWGALMTYFMLGGDGT